MDKLKIFLICGLSDNAVVIEIVVGKISQRFKLGWSEIKDVFSVADAQKIINTPFGIFEITADLKLKE